MLALGQLSVNTHKYLLSSLIIEPKKTVINKAFYYGQLSYNKPLENNPQALQLE